jgi:hypothetical protein
VICVYPNEAEAHKVSVQRNLDNPESFAILEKNFKLIGIDIASMSRDEKIKTFIDDEHNIVADLRKHQRYEIVPDTFSTQI